ncbi:substrate binding domain-containing protein [Methylobacterium tardum]|nr:substrate binding domain-containing protein [Methylobacterium tardum]URD39478.1 substrate binding domain-containing protein [Methylobacterium tardum]
MRWLPHPIKDRAEVKHPSDFRNHARGPLRDSGLVARRVLTYRHRLVASPGYLAEHPAPVIPRDLHNHRLLAFSLGKPDHRWTFIRAGHADRETVTFQPHFTMNDYIGLATALMAGSGIGDLPPVVQPEPLRDGRLIEVMPGWQFRTFDLSLVHLGHRHLPQPVRLFKDFATQMTASLFPDLPV